MPIEIINSINTEEDGKKYFVSTRYNIVQEGDVTNYYSLEEISRTEIPEKMDLIEKRLDDPLCDIYPSCGNSMEELLASIIIKAENPPQIPRLDNIEIKINQIIDFANEQGANIDNL